MDAPDQANPPEIRDFKALVADYERHLIREALASSAGVQRRAARRLGILPTTLHEKMKRLGLFGPAAAHPGVAP